MTLKKSKFSNISWILYVLTALVFSDLICTRVAGYFYLDKAVGLILTVILFGLSILFVLIGTMSKRKQESKEDVRRIYSAGTDRIFNVITLIVCLVFILAGVFFRIRYLNDQFFIQALADRSMVPFYPSELSGINGIAELYYYSFLEFLFFVFGNFGQTVLILNTVICVLNAVILYFAVKRLLGRCAAACCIGLFMLSPYSVNMTLNNGPELMALIFSSLSLLFIAEILPCDDLKIFPALFAGIFFGLSIANDLACVSLLLAIIPMFIRSYIRGENSGESKDIPYGAGKRAITLGVLLASTVVGGILALLIYSGMSGKTFGQTAVSVINSALVFDNKVTLSDNIDLISGFIITVLLMVGIAAGFIRKKIDQGSFIFLICVGAVAVNCLGGSSFLMGQGLFVFVLLSAFAGHSVDNLVLRNAYFEMKKNTEDDTEIERTAFDRRSKDIPVKISEIKGGTSEVTASDTIKTPESGAPLDNPLPVPEHKAKKIVDYDYYVAENADYDI